MWTVITDYNPTAADACKLEKIGDLSYFKQQEMLVSLHCNSDHTVVIMVLHQTEQEEGCEGTQGSPGS